MLIDSRKKKTNLGKKKKAGMGVCTNTLRLHRKKKGALSFEGGSDQQIKEELAQDKRKMGDTWSRIGKGVE